MIRLYELQLIDYATIKEYFDQKFDYHKEFEALGIDSYMIERSNVIHFGKIEMMMQKYTLPEIAQQANKQVLEEITRYFHTMKGDAVD
ncbi:hypothetical protein ACUC2M_14915 [Bacillus cytotoxicus]